MARAASAPQLQTTAWVLPEPSSTGAHDRLAVDDAVSVTSFPLTALSFTATFPSLGATRGHPSNFSDELVVFAATDVTDYHGYEFGVRESLSDGAVFAYWQSPSAGGIVVFHETPLFASDGRVHAFDLVRVGPALVFIVDGARTVTAAFPTAPTSGFFVVTTAHRASDGWSAPGLALSVADLSESSGGL